jgi:hypothetical protein
MAGSLRVDHERYSDDYLRRILTEVRTIAVVGVSPHPELHPDHLDPFRDRRVDDLAGRGAAAKHVDHIDRLRDIGEPGMARLAIDLRCGGEGVDRDGAIAAALHIGHDAMARPLLLGLTPTTAMVRTSVRIRRR